MTPPPTALAERRAATYFIPTVGTTYDGDLVLYDYLTAEHLEVQAGALLAHCGEPNRFPCRDLQLAKVLVHQAIDLARAARRQLDALPLRPQLAQALRRRRRLAHEIQECLDRAEGNAA